MFALVAGRRGQSDEGSPADHDHGGSQTEGTANHKFVWKQWGEVELRSAWKQAAFTDFLRRCFDVLRHVCRSTLGDGTSANHAEGMVNGVTHQTVLRSLVASSASILQV